MKWSSRNDGFEDKKRTGRPKILNEAAKRMLNKAKYKQGKLDQTAFQQFASKGHVGGINTIWRFMKSEGWRPLRRQKKPLLLGIKAFRNCQNKVSRKYFAFGNS